MLLDTNLDNRPEDFLAKPRCKAGKTVERREVGAPVASENNGVSPRK
jgi:hypothetical protein